MRVVKQQLFEFKSWGGAREGAGRKCQTDRSGVAHRARQVLKVRHPVHVTLRLVDGLATLRNRNEFAAVGEALLAGSERGDVRVVEFAVLHNHVHLVCEAAEERSLARGIQGLCVRIARALNRLWRRSGAVFADRYHCHVLESPREVLEALNYVLHNAAHHGAWLCGPDPYSSGAWFDGWRHALGTKHGPHTSPLPRARTWLLRTGWRVHGLLDPVPPPAFVLRRSHARRVARSGAR